MISASQVYSPLSPMSRNGLSSSFAVWMWSKIELGVEALGVLLEARHQVRALHAVGVGGPVVDVGGRHQLAALRETGDQHRLQVGARGVYCGGVAGGAGAEDQQAGVLRGHAILAFGKSVDSTRCGDAARRPQPASPMSRSARPFAAAPIRCIMRRMKSFAASSMFFNRKEACIRAGEPRACAPQPRAAAVAALRAPRARIVVAPRRRRASSGSR